MRQHFLFLSTMVAMFSAVVYFATALRTQKFLSFGRETVPVRDFLTSYQATHTALTEINLSALYGGQGQFQILHPAFAVKSLQLPLRTATCAPAAGPLVPNERPPLQCQATDVSRLQKHQDFQRILADHGAPVDFVFNPPFVDESGKSFAALLSRADIAPFNQAEWVRQHLSFFATGELKEVLKRFNIQDPAFETISRLGESEIKMMVEGMSVVLTPDFLLLRNESRLGFSPLSYWVYDARDLASELRRGDYELLPSAGDAFCLERIGNACWTFNSKSTLASVYRYSFAIIVLTSIALVILASIYARYVWDRHRKQKLHQTSLLVLSHEFRTPVSAMLLLSEELSRNLSRLSERDQDSVTKISAEAFRMQRIIEMSKTYLQSTSSSPKFNPVPIPSVNSWIADFAADTDPRIRCELLEQDQSIEADHFWLRFALGNLVQNAFAHGKEPVRIRLSQKGKQIVIDVEDEGTCEFRSLKRMGEAFTKSPTSHGMGLGLNIVSSVVRAWGGELKFRRSPTTFSIAFPRKLKG